MFQKMFAFIAILSTILSIGNGAAVARGPAQPVKGDPAPAEMRGTQAWLASSSRGMAPGAADCSTVTEIPQAECEVLVVLYNRAGGPNWTNHTDWLVTNTPCSWSGVECNGGHVTYIYLYANNLVGSIPPELGSLANLQYLCLAHNNLHGSIPPELGSLVNLGVLYLESNALSGSIPPELGRLVNLQNLYLDFNALSGSIPPELGNLPNLYHLHLNDNDLHGSIPPELGKLTNLVTLYLWRNQLSGSIPPELGNLPILSELYLTWNQLSGPIPPELGNLTNLQGLNLGGNQLSGTIPSALGGLVNLWSLDLSRNALTGRIPAALTNLVKLGSQLGTTVDFGYNALSSTDPALTAFLNLKDPDWASTQTVPPADLQAASVAGGVLLTWTPIAYTQDGGYYEISYATSFFGPYTVHGTTPDKNAASYQVAGLASDAPYYIRLRTYTPAHGEQHNDLWSQYTRPVSNSFTVFMPSIHR